MNKKWNWENVRKLYVKKDEPKKEGK